MMSLSLLSPCHVWGGAGGGVREGGVEGGGCMCVCVWGGDQMVMAEKNFGQGLECADKKMVNFQSKYENIVFSSYLCHP